MQIKPVGELAHSKIAGRKKELFQLSVVLSECFVFVLNVFKSQACKLANSHEMA